MVLVGGPVGELINRIIVLDVLLGATSSDVFRTNFALLGVVKVRWDPDETKKIWGLSLYQDRNVIPYVFIRALRW